MQFVYLVLLALLVPGGLLSAQPVKPNRTTTSERNYIGLEGGLTGSMQFGGRNYAVAGTYADGSRNAELSQYELAISYMGHVVLDLAFSKDLGLQTKVGYRINKANAQGISSAGNISGGDPQLTNNVNFTWDYLAVDALLRVQLMKNGLYVLGGLGYSSLLENYVSGKQTSNSAGGNNQQMGFEGELINFYNDSKLDAKFGIGTWLPLGDGGVMIAPELTIGIPLTSLHSDETVENYQSIDREVNNMAYGAIGFAIKFPFGGTDDEAPLPSPVASSGIKPEPEQEPATPRSVTLRGRVVDDAGRIIDGAQVTVVDLNNNQVIASSTVDDGHYNIPVSVPGRYSVTADAPDYLFGSTLQEVDKLGRIHKSTADIALSRSLDGRVRLLVFFDFDKATLQSASNPELDRAVALMKANANMQVEIAGFTDAQGTNSYNKDLSQRRANAVRDYLIGKGVDASRLSAVGYGEINAVASNDTEEGRAENRRVEFVVVKR
jgi:outer membrane protein OmpA-like peptidoglycan-associated protein